MMGQAKQRRLQAVQNGTPHPAKPPAYQLIEGQVIDQQQADGTILRIQLFHVADKDGIRAMNTPSGPVPITIASLPVPVGKGIIVPSGPLPGV